MKEGGPGYLSDMMIEGEGGVKGNSKVTDVGGRGQEGVVGRESEVVGRFDEGFWADDNDVCFVVV